MHAIHYGHACLKLVGPDAATLIDPWLSRDGAFFRSWFQFPENHGFLDEALGGSRQILVSHNHEDHFDVQVFRRALSADDALRLHVARFPTRWFRRRAERLLGDFAGRIVEHAPWEPFAASCGGEIFFVPEESPGQVDSAIVWRDGDRNLVNLNDARLNTAQFHRIRERLGRVETFCLQGSGASEYPINYRYDEAEMQRRKIEKREAKLGACERMIDLLEPRRLLFFAGPPVFLDPDLASQNDVSTTLVFPDQLDILKTFAATRPDIGDRAWFLMPGDALDDAHLFSRVNLADDRYAPYTRKADYIETYRERRRDLLPFDRGEPASDALLLKHFSALVTVSPWAARKIGGEVEFRIRGAARTAVVTADFARGEARLGAAASPLYVLEAPASSVDAVLSGAATWDDVMLSIRMDFDERTPRFVSHLKTLLKYADAEQMEALRRYEDALCAAEASEDLITIDCDGTPRRIQRRCPHAGVDLLEHGRVEGDTIVCLAHRFRFDLASGRCLNSAGFSIRVEPAD